MERKRMELLAPAGDWERLEMALAYGADAVYLAGDTYGMRSFAGNFSQAELARAAKLCREKGVDLHVTCNTMPRNDEVARLPQWLSFLEECGVTAVILADVGVLALAKQYAPHVKVHISTQASIVNYQAARAWHDLGADRVILARELSLEEIVEDRDLRPWGHVRVLLGPVSAVQLHDRTGRQPGRLCPALPLPVRPGGGEAAGGVFPH